ncbi:hypothetical protein E4U21_000378 [Claviceps maximensis]|nr:hypothetical protein E4U21_000378 [Claviceps maximensis]
MAKSSSDGRSREKASKYSSHDRNGLVRGLAKQSIEHLKPASPPKTNPWTTRRPTTTVSPDWPSITPDFVGISSQGDKNEAILNKDVAQTTHDQHNPCWSSHARRSDTHLPPETEWKGPTPRPGKNLWLRPFGADVFVRAGSQIFEVHRSIVEPQSTFFQQHLPSRRDLNLWAHDPIDIQLELHPDAVANTLRFMYTKALESCEYDRKSPRDWAHVPRSVLLYIAAVDLGVEAIKTKILQILRQTVKDVASYFQARVLAQALNEQEAVDGVFHLHNALDAAYSSRHHLPDMLPLRLALCQFLDTLLPFLIQHPVMMALLSSGAWEKYAADISAELLAARNDLEKGTAADARMNHDDQGEDAGVAGAPSSFIEENAPPAAVPKPGSRR